MQELNPSISKADEVHALQSLKELDRRSRLINMAIGSGAGLSRLAYFGSPIFAVVLAGFLLLSGSQGVVPAIAVMFFYLLCMAQLINKRIDAIVELLEIDQRWKNENPDQKTPKGD